MASLEVRFKGKVLFYASSPAYVFIAPFRWLGAKRGSFFSQFSCAFTRSCFRLSRKEPFESDRVSRMRNEQNENAKNNKWRKSY